MSDDIRIQSLKTGIDIIEILVEEGGCTLADLSDRLEKPQSTVYDHLLTLNELKYVVKDDNKYRVSSEFLYMGITARNQMQLCQLASPQIKELASRTGEHVSLMTEEFDMGVLIYIEKGEQALDLGVSVGYRMDLQTTAPGKAILAHLPQERAETIIDKFGLPERTENTITSKEKLLEDLKQVRQQGYATDKAERVEGIRAVAAPIVTEGDVHGALTISGPANRMTGEWFSDELPDLLLQSTNVIEIQHSLE